jgi:hypothetical protein
VAEIFSVALGGIEMEFNLHNKNLLKGTVSRDGDCNEAMEYR